MQKTRTGTISILFLLSLIAFHLPSTYAFANQKGWKTRPVVPELAKAPEEETSQQVKREKWDVLRFISQSSKFVSLPKPPIFSKAPIKVSPGDTLWKIGMDDSNTFTFAPLDDVVMGGVSSSTFSSATGKWTGTVSESNSGGFIGIRSTPFSNTLDMSGCEGIEITFKGSRNQIFKAVVRDSTDFNGICWTSTFCGEPSSQGNSDSSLFSKILGRNNEAMDKIDEPYTIKISFDELIPTIFARTVPNQNLNKATIEGFQLAYSKFLFDGELNPKFSLGDFSLNMLELRAY
ncbi:hypothetical protein CTEN210_07636 [Chaetoceros tenuissimus]|uniref:NADH:ubiquinone oxidoreductase intermediate-associated protein 30 domain-containing protein n=1 Tax=Chaetoceros tenuissimus TaxID=426638 RepID=A0AAD3CU87_9STRA|nr:hypothetical protein CTEN210_07636 [Chaetoceros tenuissimus]